MAQKAKSFWGLCWPNERDSAGTGRSAEREESPCWGGRMCTVLALGLAGTYSILLLWLEGLFRFFSPLS